jgi:hypothetical protein
LFLSFWCVRFGSFTRAQEPNRSESPKGRDAKRQDFRAGADGNGRDGLPVTWQDRVRAKAHCLVS